MGKLIYGIAPAIEIDDRGLRHLQVAIFTKLRRDERFTFSWGDEPLVGEDVALDGEEGRYGTVWLSSAASLYFSYDRHPSGPLNKAWVEALLEVANRTGGLRLISEPAGQ
jgi:hypothetical protein